MYIVCAVNNARVDKVLRNLYKSIQLQPTDLEVELVLVNYKLEKLKVSKEYTVKIITPPSTTGFGESHNFAFRTLKPSEPFLIINPDTFLHKDAIKNLLNTYNSKKDIGIVEPRQLPFAHPKEYDHKTKETPWASGSCMLINPKAFEEIGGFDGNFWMYTEDVDLSWRMWLADYKVLHEPTAVVYHHTGAFFDYFDDRYYQENFWCARNFIYIMRKYWGDKGEKDALKMLENTGYPKEFKEAVQKNYLENKRSFKETKVDKKKLNELKDWIKVTGFNLFHDFD